MSTSEKLTMVIPARSGSKRVVGKNMRDLCGKPLLFYTIDSVVNQRLVSDVIFSSDSEDYISAVTKEYGDRVRCVLRPSALSADTTKVTEELARLIHTGEISTHWFAMSLPTTPLFDHSKVETVLEHWAKSQQPCFSCSEYEFSPLFAFMKAPNGWTPIIDEGPMVTGNTRSQDLQTFYRPTGACYVTNKEIFSRRKILYDDAVAVVFDRKCSIDIDEELDFSLAQAILEKSGEHSI